MILTEAQETLLKRVTKQLNEDADRNYREGELDFIPETWTEERALDLIITKYCLEHCPAALEHQSKEEQETT